MQTPEERNISITMGIIVVTSLCSGLVLFAITKNSTKKSQM